MRRVWSTAGLLRSTLPHAEEKGVPTFGGLVSRIDGSPGGSSLIAISLAIVHRFAGICFENALILVIRGPFTTEEYLDTHHKVIDGVHHFKIPDYIDLVDGKKVKVEGPWMHD